MEKSESGHKGSSRKEEPKPTKHGGDDAIKGETTQPSPVPKSVQNPPPDSVPITTTTEPRVDPNDTTRIQEGQSSVRTVWEATAFPEIPSEAHELVVILQFGTSYELVEWLVKRLQEVSERMAQEHRDQIMI